MESRIREREGEGAVLNLGELGYLTDLPDLTELLELLPPVILHFLFFPA
jgi:hypothetical protein